MSVRLYPLSASFFVVFFLVHTGLFHFLETLPQPDHTPSSTCIAMAASVDMKIKILKKSMSTFSSWLDGCHTLVNELPDQLGKSDPAHLRELALKYKVHVRTRADDLLIIISI